MKQLQDALTTALGTHQARTRLHLMRRIARLFLSHASAQRHCSSASSLHLAMVASAPLSGQQLDAESGMQIL